MNATRKVICPMCNKSISASNFAKHRKLRHGLHSRLKSWPADEKSAESSSLFVSQDVGTKHNAIQDCVLTELSTLSVELTNLWASSTTWVPRTFPTAKCWANGTTPSFNDVWDAVMSTVEAGDHENARATGVALRQIFRSNSTTPKAATSIVVPTIQSEGTLRLPNGYLPALVTSGEEFPLTADINPRHSFIDLSVDGGVDRLSTAVDDCVKLWILFPPTFYNLRLWLDVKNADDRLLRVGQHLEGGIVYKQTSSTTIHLPSGCLYAVVALESGFSVDTTFTCEESIESLARSIALGDIFSAKTKDLMTSYVSRLREALKYQVTSPGACLRLPVLLAIRSWVDNQQFFNRFFANPGTSFLLREALNTWDGFLQGSDFEVYQCPCNFEICDLIHFRMYHLDSLRYML